MVKASLTQSLCNYGRARTIPARAYFPKSRPAGLKYLPVGIAYHLYDYAAGYLGPKIDGSLPVVTQPMLSSGYPSDTLLGINVMLSQGVIQGGEQKADREAVKEVGDRVFGIIDQTTKTSKGEFDSAHFNLCLKFAFSEKDETPPSGEAVLDYLLGSYKIEEIAEGRYRVANQIVSITEASILIRRELPGTGSLGSVFKTAEEVFNILWETSSHAIYDRDSEKLILAGRAKGRAEDSPYLNWAKPEYLYKEAIRRFVETGDTSFEVDLRAEYEKYKAGQPTFINPDSIENDLEVFLLNPDDPGKIVVGVYTFVDDVIRATYALDRLVDEKKALHQLRHGSIRGVFSASNRLINGESGYNRFLQFPALIYRPPFSSNASVRDVAVNLHTNILREIAQKVSIVVGNKTVRKVWDKEQESLRSMESAEAVSFAGLAIREDASLSTKRKKEVLAEGQLLPVKDLWVRLLENPTKKFHGIEAEAIEWIREVILSVYHGTKLAQGKSREDLIRELSLEDDKMVERIILPEFLALVEGPEGKEAELGGVVSGTLLKIKGNGPGDVLKVFRVPEAMIRKEARGRKLEVALSSAMVSRVFRQIIMEKGFFKGFYYLLAHGLPFYATTQSLRVAKDLMRLKDLSLMRLAKGKKLSDLHRKVVEVGSDGEADEKGIEAGAYGGRVAIDEEEKGLVLVKPHWFFRLPIIRLFFKKHIQKANRMDQEIKRIFAEEVGRNGRMHLVGYFTIVVSLKIAWELFVNRLRKRRSKSDQ